MSKKRTTAASSVRESRKSRSVSYTTKNVLDEEIDCSDIPELTQEQLAKFRPLSKRKRKLFKLPK